MSLLNEQEEIVDFDNQLDNVRKAIKRSFLGSREGLQTVDIDEYLRTRDLLVQLFRSYNAEVHRVCFCERLSNRPCDLGS
jgi:hypothetical protein